MDKQKALELITNGFNAAGRIKELQPSLNTRGTEGRFRQDDLQNLFGILQIISEYSPEKYRTPLSQAIGRSRRYIETYSNLRKHIGSLEKPRMRSSNIINTLGVIKPVLGANEALIADKIIKIYALLNDWS